MFQFDAYAATLRGGQALDDVAQALAHDLGGIVAKGRPMRRCGTVLNVDVGPRMAAWVGLDSSSTAIFIEGKGETSPQLVQSIRTRYPLHSVPRADVKDDINEPGAFEALIGLVRDNKGPRVKGGYVALPDDVQDGRTWAAGVRGGVAFVRVYEAGKHPDRLHLNLPNWVRPEGEFRPHYARDKVAASTMTPEDFWGLTSWTHKVGEALSGLSINRFEPEIRRYTHGKTMRYLALNFERHWREMMENGEDITRTIQAVWEEEAEFKAAHSYAR
jgi:hypothetical protein